MNEVFDFFRKLTDTSDWPPRWYCGEWTGFHGWLYIYSDIAIWLAYFAIPVILIWFVQRRTDIPFLPVFWLFGAFIVLCGTTHILDAIIFWWPAYRISALFRFFTAVVSLLTVYALLRDLPKALQLKGPSALKEEEAKRQQAENDLEQNEVLLQKLYSEIQERDNEIKTLQAELDRR